MLSGNELERWTGDQLQYRDVVRPGDYATNVSDVEYEVTEKGFAVVGRVNGLGPRTR